MKKIISNQRHWMASLSVLCLAGCNLQMNQLTEQVTYSAGGSSDLNNIPRSTPKPSTPTPTTTPVPTATPTTTPKPTATPLPSPTPFPTSTPTGAQLYPSAPAASSYVTSSAIGAPAGYPSFADVNPSPAPKFSVTGPGTVFRIGAPIESGGNGQLIISTPVAIGALKCGDTLAIRAGTYRGIAINGITGCAGNPITLTNDGGQVVIDDLYQKGTWGMNLTEFNHVVVKSATPNTYGFKIMRAYVAAVQISNNSNDVDISGVYALDVGYGFAIKTDPACNTLSYLSPNIMDNIVIHDNYILGTEYEGIYAGFWTNSPVQLTCNGQTQSVIAENVSRVSLSHNILRNTGNDALKLRSCVNGCDIKNNSVDGYAILRTDDASWCFGITTGSYTYGEISGNFVSHGYCSAIDIRTNAVGQLINVHDNVTSYAGYLPNGKTGATWANGIEIQFTVNGEKFSIMNNVSSHHISGTDLFIANYGPSGIGYFSYDGTSCNNGAKVVVSPNTPLPKSCGP